ncbi:MAG: TonB-dependent receptor [Caulobacteraceae bacterium]
MSLLLKCGWAGPFALAALAALPVAAQPAAAPPNHPSDAQSSAGAQSAAAATVSEIVVTARRLNAARVSIQPAIGASTYTINHQAIQAMPGGADASLSDVILQAPGVAEDANGQLHVRGEHNGLQYRLDGVILPEGLDVFSQALSPRVIDNVRLITGALPAEFGLRTAGIIDITTRSERSDGGDLAIYGGAHSEFNPSGDLYGNSGPVNWFASASWLQDDLGIDSPDASADPLHDWTRQFRGFAYLEDILSREDRVSVMLSSSDQRFQIPDQLGLEPTLGLSVANPTGAPTLYPSQDLNERQTENTQFAALSWLHAGERLTSQVSLVGRYSTLLYQPDPLGDLLWQGVSQQAYRQDVATDLQGEAAYKLASAHTVRGGFLFEIDRSISRTTSQVLAVNAAGAQIGGPPFQPETIGDNGALTAKTFSLWGEDEWRILPGLTFNYGLRYDRAIAFRDEDQVSPRINLVWDATPGTTFHAGYARYFSPPPFELVASKDIAKFAGTTGAPLSSEDTDPYSERANYYDLGISQSVARGLKLGLDSYYKADRDLLDEGQFGAAVILTPFNYAAGRQYGVELTADYDHGPLSAWANFAAQKAEGKDIVSGQFNFDAADLAYIADHFIFLDHSAALTASGGADWRLGANKFGLDFTYGSGLRADLALPSGEVIPNGQSLPGYVQVNLSLSHRFDLPRGGPITARLDLINAFDEVYQIRNGSGVGVFAPQYGSRRGLFVGLAREF